MTVSYLLSGYLLIGLASDTKPADSPNGAMYVEYDTNKVYVKNGATWTLNVSAAGGTYNPVGVETFQNKTIPTDQNTIKNSTTNTAGDILLNNGTKFDRLAKGTASQVLSVKADGSTLEWATVATGGASWNPVAVEVLQNKTATVDQNVIKDSVNNLLGDLLKNNGTKFVRFPKGAAGQLLRVNSGATDLEWYTMPNPTGAWDPLSAETLKNKTMNYNENTFNGFFNFPSYGRMRGAWHCLGGSKGFMGFWQGLFTSQSNISPYYTVADGNFCRLQNPTTNGGTSYIRTAANDYFTSIDANPYIKFKIKTESVGGTRQYYGFTDNLSVTNYANEHMLDDYAGVMFHLADDTLTWSIQHNDGSGSMASEPLTPNLTPANGAVITFEIKGVASSGKWQYRYNGNAWVDITSQIPLSNNQMGIAFMNMQNTATMGKYANIYYAEQYQDK